MSYKLTSNVKDSTSEIKTSLWHHTKQWYVHANGTSDFTKVPLGPRDIELTLWRLLIG